MSRRRLTSETLDGAVRLAAAKETIQLAEGFLGPGASDKEVLATAASFRNLSPQQIRELNRRKAIISNQTRRLAANPDGADDILEESGPEQPDPTNNQAYTKQVMVTPDHAVMDSLQKRSLHNPTAGKRKLRAAETEPEEEEPDLDSDDDVDDLDSDDDVDDLDSDDDDDVDDLDSDDDEFDLEEEDPDLEAMMEYADDEHSDDDDQSDDVPHSDDEHSDDDDHSDDVLHSDDADDLDEIIDEDDDNNEFDDEDLPEIKDEDGADNGVGHDLPVKVPASRRHRANRFTLDDTLDLDPSDLESRASTQLEGDDLDALTGAKVTRAGNRSASSGFIPRIRPEDRAEGYTWDTENEPEISGRAPKRARKASSHQKTPPSQPKKARARKASYAPDRRRIAASPSAEGRDPFDEVFGVPDVNKFFQD